MSAGLMQLVSLAPSRRDPPRLVRRAGRLAQFLDLRRDDPAWVVICVIARVDPAVASSGVPPLPITNLCSTTCGRMRCVVPT
jgi:hypothetical protein